MDAIKDYHIIIKILHTPLVGVSSGWRWIKDPHSNTDTLQRREVSWLGVDREPFLLNIHNNYQLMFLITEITYPNI